MAVSDKYRDALAKINDQIVAITNEKKNVDVSSEDYRDLIRKEIECQNQMLSIVKEIN